MTANVSRRFACGHNPEGNMQPTHSFETTCCFSGHRPGPRLNWDNQDYQRRADIINRLCGEILRLAQKEGYDRFLCGMALGGDLLFAEAVLNVRAMRLFNITLEAVLPCPTQAKSWPPGDAALHEFILGECDAATTVAQRYSPQCMFARNRLMVDSSSLLLALYDEKPGGGTAYTVKYARKNGVKCIVLAP